MAVSEFQLALIGAGVVAIAAVWGYNSWQEYRHRRAAEKVFRGNQGDVLIDELPLEEVAAATQGEPSLRPDTAPSRVESRLEPVFSLPQDEQLSAYDNTAEVKPVETDSTVLQESVKSIESPDEELLDPMIEVGMPLPTAETVAAMQLAWQNINKIDFGKRIRWVAREAGNGEWIEVVEPSSAADHAYVAIQLADRQGAIALDELRVFCQTAAAVATAHGGEDCTPALEEIIAHARAIDDLCASVDIQIAIHIVSRSGQVFAGSKLKGMLEAAGLQLAVDGLFYLLDAEGRRLLSVCNSGAVPFDIEQMRTGTIPDVTFWLDVPRVSNGGHVFDIMVATARQLAEALGGVLVDDQRAPLADNVLSGIRAKVIELQTQMAAHGITAGGRRALRLFA